MKFEVCYSKKEKLELTVNLDFPEKKEAECRAIAILRIVSTSVITITVIASMLAVYGAEHGHQELIKLAGRILEMPHYVKYVYKINIVFQKNIV